MSNHRSLEECQTPTNSPSATIETHERHPWDCEFPSPYFERDASLVLDTLTFLNSTHRLVHRASFRRRDSIALHDPRHIAPVVDISFVSGILRPPPSLHNGSQLSNAEEGGKEDGVPPFDPILSVRFRVLAGFGSIAAVHSSWFGTGRRLPRGKQDRSTCFNETLCSFRRTRSSGGRAEMDVSSSNEPATCSSQAACDVPGVLKTKRRIHPDMKAHWNEPDPLEKWWEWGEKIWFLVEGMGSLATAWYMTVQEHKGTTLLQAVQDMDSRIEW